MIGQPTDYSAMLKRIFWATLTAGIICTLTLAGQSPKIKNLIELSPQDWDLGPVTLPLFVVLLPLLFALFSRICTLHNQISKLFKIRETFDVNNILIKLAEGVGFTVDDTLRLQFKQNRHALMRDVFYKYAPNVADATINAQLVSNAFDKWGWFWCFMEPSVVVLISAIVAWFAIGFHQFLIYIFFLFFLILIAIAIYPSCIKAAKHEVDDILSDNKRKQEVINIFNAL